MFNIILMVFLKNHAHPFFKNKFFLKKGTNRSQQLYTLPQSKGSRTSLSVFLSIHQVSLHHITLLHIQQITTFSTLTGDPTQLSEFAYKFLSPVGETFLFLFCKVWKLSLRMVKQIIYQHLASEQESWGQNSSLSASQVKVFVLPKLKTISKNIKQV